MKNIKNIVVPIDFSVTARNAYQYALNLAQLIEAKITVVNVRANLIFASDIPVVSYSQLEEETQAEELKNFIADENNVSHQFALKSEVKTSALLGDPETTLIELSKTNGTDLMIIGSTGLEDIISKIMGSVSLKLANQAHCPVIIVPRNVKWQPIRNILFASNFDSMTPSVMLELSDFTLQLKAHLHFIHVHNYDQDEEHEEKEIDWSKLLGLTQKDLSYEVHTVFGKTVVAELKKYCDDREIDLIVFASKHRGFWENLMHKSISENMAFTTSVPMMVMHFDDKI